MYNTTLHSVHDNECILYMRSNEMLFAATTKHSMLIMR